MVDNLDAMRERDHAARREKVYGHPSTAKAREQDAGHKATPQSGIEAPRRNRRTTGAPPR
jgi:hypothetical protein